MSVSQWLPEGHHADLHIQHRPVSSAGRLDPNAGAKAIMHITVSPWMAVDAMARSLIDEGFCPNLLIGGREGLKHPVVIQFMPLDETSKALQHPVGTPETNAAGCRQIEICAEPDLATAIDHHAPKEDVVEFWPRKRYQAIANLLWMIRHGEHPRAPIPLRVPRPFADDRRFTPAGFIRVTGITGHKHVPNQPDEHEDPTRHFNGAMLLSDLKTAPHSL